MVVSPPVSALQGFRRVSLSQSPMCSACCGGYRLATCGLQFLMTGNQNTEGRPSHSLLLFPELDLMLDRPRYLMPLLVVRTDCGVLHPETAPLQTGASLGPDKWF